MIVTASEALLEGIIVDEMVGFDDLGGQRSRLVDAAPLGGGLIEAPKGSAPIRGP